MPKSYSSAEKQIDTQFVRKNGRYDIGIGTYTPEAKNGDAPKTFISLRLWTVDREGKHLPTREGFVFDIDTLPAVIDALSTLRAELE